MYGHLIFPSQHTDQQKMKLSQTAALFPVVYHLIFEPLTCLRVYNITPRNHRGTLGKVIDGT